MAWWGRQSQAGHAARQRQTFEALLRPHLDALFRTAMRLTGHRGQAEDEAMQAGHQSGPVGQYNQRAFIEQAQKALNDLPEDLRLVVCMALLEDMSYQDIVDALGCPIGTVRSRLSRGRYRMQQMLAEFAPEQKRDPSLRLSVVKLTGRGR